MSSPSKNTCLHPVDDDDMEHESSQSKESTACCGARVISISKLAVGTVVILSTILSWQFILASAATSNFPPTAVEHAKSCGSSAEEARTLSCRFDVIRFAWVPDDCHDGSLSNEFLEEHNWRWWRDTEHQAEVPISEVQLGEQSFFTTWEYHLVHCIYSLKLMHRALLHGRPVDNVTASYEHTEHCQRMFLNRTRDAQEVNSIALLKFLPCKVIWDSLPREAVAAL